jgi:hypothetical protein
VKQAALLILMFAAGCAQQSFNIDPAAVRESAAHHLADKFTSDDTMIIDAPFRDPMAILAVVAVDRPAGTFELVGLNHMGVQIFHLSGDRAGVHIKSAIPPLMQQKRILLSIAQDTRNMYLDVVPAENAKAKATRRGVRFSTKTNDGTLIHDSAGIHLAEKRLKGLIRTKWRIRYADYKDENGKLHPRRIVLNNGRYFYTISVKNRQFKVK